jgi:hypothetical protein
MYPITKYSYDQAKKLNVKIQPSNKRDYKIDVYDNNNNYITSIGNKNYSDYPSYMLSHGKAYANKRRELYKKRHEKDRHNIGSRGYYSDQILW